MLLLAAVLVATALWGQDREDPTTAATREMFLVPVNRTNQFPGAMWAKRAPNLFLTNGISRKAPPTVFRVQPLGAPGGGQLQPGIYETEPYTCIVVVPGPLPDDKIIVGRGRPEGTNVFVPRMPMVQPELRFIPRGKR